MRGAGAATRTRVGHQVTGTAGAGGAVRRDTGHGEADPRSSAVPHLDDLVSPGDAAAPRARAKRGRPTDGTDERRSNRHAYRGTRRRGRCDAGRVGGAGGGGDWACSECCLGARNPPRHLRPDGQARSRIRGRRWRVRSHPPGSGTDMPSPHHTNTPNPAPRTTNPANAPRERDDERRSALAAFYTAHHAHLAGHRLPRHRGAPTKRSSPTPARTPGCSSSAAPTSPSTATASPGSSSSPSREAWRLADPAPRTPRRRLSLRPRRRRRRGDPVREPASPDGDPLARVLALETPARARRALRPASSPANAANCSCTLIAIQY